MISNLSLSSDPCCTSTSDGIFEDSIASICWHPIEFVSLLAVSSWESKIRIYQVSEVDNRPSLAESGAFNTEVPPCLALSWCDPTTRLIIGSIDGKVSAIDATHGTNFVTFGKHDDAVQGVYQIPSTPHVICSVSYDSVIKFWDIRNPGGATRTIDLGAKVVCSALTHSYLAIGLSNQKFHVFDITQAFETGNIEPPLDITGIESSLSDVSLSKDLAIGFGCSDGRSSLSWLESTSNTPLMPQRSFFFRAHKSDPGQNGNTTNSKIMYPINAVGMHPRNKDTYFTASRDGWINFWNITKRTKIAGFATGGVPVTKARYSPQGKYLAYGIGYDWSNGIEGAKSYKTKLCIHKVQPNEVVQEN